jgi:hypothetical protein
VTSDTGQWRHRASQLSVLRFRRARLGRRRGDGEWAASGLDSIDEEWRGGEETGGFARDWRPLRDFVRSWRRVAEFHHEGHEGHEGNALCQNSAKQGRESPWRTEGREAEEGGREGGNSEWPMANGEKRGRAEGTADCGCCPGAPGLDFGLGRPEGLTRPRRHDGNRLSSAYGERRNWVTVPLCLIVDSLISASKFTPL